MAQLADIQVVQNKLEETFTKRMAELETQLQSGGSAKDTVAKVAEEFRTFRELMFSMLKLLRQQITECTRMVDAVETRHRRKALLFLGVPERDNEDCRAVVRDMLIKSMGLTNISSSTFRACHRLGSHNKDHQRPILVRFPDSDLRSTAWRAKSKLKGSPITVKEFLTRARQFVFVKARQHFGMRACWTQDGIIHIKAQDGSHHKVTPLEELDTVLVRYPAAVQQSSSVSRSGPGVVKDTAKPRRI